MIVFGIIKLSKSMWGVGLLYLGTGVKLASFNHLGSLYNGIVDKLGSFNDGNF
jgi:hypothetical protein|tara:strand:+ start:1006 stop:1164 length:159 start_codon:yes stop_codon:yes gene_type:complete